MDVPSLAKQRAELLNIQRRHAQELMKSGIASRAFKRRFDEEWFSDANESTASAESLPVAMIDTSDPKNTYLYVFLKRDEQDGRVQGEEVNVATITNSGTSHEEIIPEHGFTVDEASTVRALANELITRRQTDLPNLSDDLLVIVDK